jgi:CheY-like chemotaxis protein
MVNGIMADTRWDIKRGANVYHQVSSARLKSWINTGKIKVGEAAVWHDGLSGWRKPEDLEELKASFILYEKTLGESKRPRSSEKPARGGKQIKSILLVDDEKDLCFLLGDFLNSSGFQLKCAHTQGEALKCLNERLPDLILLDLRLPDGDGMALLSLITKMVSAPAVLITTAFGSEEIRSQAEKLGALDFIDKPYHEEDLIHRIRSIRIPGAEPNKNNDKTIGSQWNLS